METAKLETLTNILASHGFQAVSKSKRKDLLELVASYDESNNYGTIETSLLPLLELQLSVLPQASLNQLYLKYASETKLKANRDEMVIFIVSGMVHQGITQGINFDIPENFDIGEILTLIRVPLNTVQQITGTTLSNRILAIYEYVQRKYGNGNKTFTDQLSHICLNQGLTPTNLIYYKTIPLPDKYSKVNKLDMLPVNFWLDAVSQHYNILPLVQFGYSNDLLVSSILDQVLTKLGFNLRLVQDNPTKIQQALSLIHLLTVYPVANWWVKVSAIFKPGIALSQYQRVITDLKLVPKDWAFLSNVVAVLFTVSHGVAPPQTVIRPEGLDILGQQLKLDLTTYLRTISKYESIVASLNLLPGDDMVRLASEYYIRLPLDQPTQTLYNSILYQGWVKMHDQALVDVIYTLSPDDVVKTLRTYNDEELLAVFPGLTVGVGGRLDLLTQLNTQLLQPHFYQLDHKIYYGTLGQTNQSYTWDELAQLAFSEFPVNQLYGLTRVLARSPDAESGPQLQSLNTFLISKYGENLPPLSSYGYQEITSAMMNVYYQMLTLGLAGLGITDDNTIYQQPADQEAFVTAYQAFSDSLADTSIPDVLFYIVPNGDISSLSDVKLQTDLDRLKPYSLALVHTAYLALHVWFGEYGNLLGVYPWVITTASTYDWTNFKPLD